MPLPSQPKKTALESSSRRGFLKLGAGAAASALAGVAIPSVHAAENNTIKLALIGCGGRGTGAVADAMHATGGPVKLVAMADLFEKRLQASQAQLKKQFADRIDAPPERCFIGFDAYKKAIDCLGPGEVVILTTYSAFRPLHFEYAVRKGVNVFMEKSFAPDAPAVRRLLLSVAESEKKDLKVGVGFMWRHSKGRQETIRRIHDGLIGDIHTLRIYRVHGPVHCPPLSKDTKELVFQIQHATCFNWATGGVFIDWHCHNVDVACWAKNAWPISAQAMGGRCYPAAGNSFDHYTVEYTFADGAKLFAFSRYMANCWSTYSDYVHGAKGSALLMAALGQPRPKIFKSQRMVDEDLVWRYSDNEPSPYHVEWQVLLDAIRQNKPHNESRRAAEASIVALMGRTAAHTGQLVTRDEQLNSTFQYVKDIDQMTFDTPAPLQAGPDGIYPAPLPGMCKEIC